MAHARFDVQLLEDERWQGIPDSDRADAVALFTGAVLLSAQMLLDGQLSETILVAIASSLGLRRRRKVIGLLARNGLLKESRAGVYVIEEWQRFHSSRRDVEEQRRRATDRKRKSRGQLTLDDVTAESQRDTPPMSQRDEGVTPARMRAGGQTQIHKPPSPPAGGSVTITKKELRRYTGCRAVRGSHGFSYVFDPLGTDRPPPDWPHEPPAEIEVVVARLAENGAMDDLEGLVAELAGRYSSEQVEQVIGFWDLEEDERIGLIDLAANLARGEASEASAV